MVKLMDANTEHGDKLENSYNGRIDHTYCNYCGYCTCNFAARRIGRVLAQNIVDPLDQLGARFDTFAKGISPANSRR